MRIGSRIAPVAAPLQAGVQVSRIVVSVLFLPATAARITMRPAHTPETAYYMYILSEICYKSHYFHGVCRLPAPNLSAGRQTVRPGIADIFS
jgi:hypothetical protein